MSGICSAHQYYERDCPQCQTEKPVWVAALESTNASLAKQNEELKAERDSLQNWIGGGHTWFDDWQAAKVRLGILTQDYQHLTETAAGAIADAAKSGQRATDLTTLLRETREDADRLRVIVRAVDNADADEYIGSIKVDVPSLGYPRSWLKVAAHDALPASEGAEA